MTRLMKVCGVTTEQEIEQLQQLGVDFFGLQVGLPSTWALSKPRAAELAARQAGGPRATLVTNLHRADQLEPMIRELGVVAVQLGVRSSPREVLQLRRLLPSHELTILQELSYLRGGFVQEERLDEFMDAGVDYILLDDFQKTPSDESAPLDGISLVDLAGFRQRHPVAPILIAGGIRLDNVVARLAASGATGIDVCTAVRSGLGIDARLVTALLKQLQKG